MRGHKKTTFLIYNLLYYVHFTLYVMSSQQTWWFWCIWPSKTVFQCTSLKTGSIQELLLDTPDYLPHVTLLLSRGHIPEQGYLPSTVTLFGLLSQASTRYKCLPFLTIFWASQLEQLWTTCNLLVEHKVLKANHCMILQHPCGHRTPHFCGLSKVHKSSAHIPPLRPIISHTNSFLSNSLDHVL